MRRRIGLFLLVGVVLPLAVAAEASAQGATLVTNVPSIRAGQEISVTGTGFNPTNANVGGVDIRLSTRDAEPLANTNPTPQGTIGPIPVPIPAGTAPGEYLLIGTQVTVRGRHTFGTPGRAKIRVTAAKGAAGVPGSPGEGPPPAAVIGTILALLALTGGTLLCARRLRTRTAQTQPTFSK